MKNLRISQVNVIDSTNVSVIFTESLSQNIRISNVSIISDTPNISDPDVIAIRINDNTLNIECQPLTSFSSYFIVFSSTQNSVFESLNGDAVLLEDGVANKQLILGPVDPSNVIHDYLVNYLRQNVYNITDSSSLVSKITQGLSVFMSEVLYDIRQIKNENYLSRTIVDELKQRNQGPFDRLLEEGAYEILRVGKTPTNTYVDSNINFISFPYYPVSLYATNVVEFLIPDSVNKAGNFNTNDLILNLSNFPVSKLKSLIINYSDATPPYNYNISKYGYQILDSRYDQEYGFNYLLLDNNQLRLNTEILSDANFSLKNIYNIQVEYEYKDLGISLDLNTVSVFSNLISTRETLPPILNTFNLKHAPIVDSQGNTPVLGGITFLDPNSFNPSIPHPAFIKEILFNLNSPPSLPGEYSIDYSTGTVYVYGSDFSKNGTTATPPLATYNYKYNYVSQIDYVYDSDTGDMVSLPYGNLRYSNANIYFKYEKVFVPDVDYVANIHKELLQERINNNLIALNAIKVKHSKITNVFRIYNETSGEVYNPIRWFNDKIYFSYVNPPNVSKMLNERASFENILNEYLFISDKLTNVYSNTILKILLKNNNIISATEDCIGSKINSSVDFSDLKTFQTEYWFDKNESELNNINRLKNIGDYQIDYANGVVYCAANNNYSYNLGTISYKRGYVSLTKPHIISVDDIYYQINYLNNKNKNFSYASFNDGFIIPLSFDYSDESDYNNNNVAPYQLSYTNLNQIGFFDVSGFIPGVSDSVKYIRGLYEFDDLKNNPSPINFSQYATFNNKVITYNNINKQEFSNVLFDGYHYVNINENIQYLSPNITLNVSVIRLSDSKQLFNGNISNIIIGNPLKVILTLNSPNINDSVVVQYSLAINDLSKIIVDYNKGDYYIDYTYLNDEILISYEYGDNYLDFRKTKALSTGDTYYVTYKVGALRDALLANFAKLVNISELSTFDVDLNRENYRDALSAALESFIQGPTISAIKNIVNNISHINPEIIESIFDGWSLGSSLLNPQTIKYSNGIKLLPAKYGNGAEIKDKNQFISFPSASNFKLEQGSLESWVIPEWNGIDNLSDLTFKISKENLPIKSNKIFIGASEYHPILDSNNYFVINKSSNVKGKPNLNKDGVFIYYDSDPSGLFDRWYLQVVDGYVGNNFDSYHPNYSIQIDSSGIFYDVKSLDYPKPSNITFTSGVNTLKISIKGGDPISLGATFIADSEKYLFDCGKEKNKNRISIYKDPSGYLNFRVYDKYKNQSLISADVSDWKENEQHHVAISWKLNSPDSKDELHLFIDGFEVPNIIKYGDKFGPYLHEKFRTVNPEEIAGVINKNIVGSNDLITSAGSPIVTSSINFSAYGILPGDKIFINELGFNTLGYTINNVNGQTLTLNIPMPVSINNGHYSVNQTSLPTLSKIDIYPNITVSTISSFLDGYDGYINIGTNTFFTTSVNLLNNNVIAGDLLRIEDGYFEHHYTILNVSANSIIINGNAPISIPSNAVYHIYHNKNVELPGLRSLSPSYSISQDGYYNNILTLKNNVKANDLILIRTLGLNNMEIKKQYYVWGNASHVIPTKLPVPISLKEVKIFHVLESSQAFNSVNSNILAPNHFNFSKSYDGYDGYTTDLIYGRSLNVEINSNNLNFNNTFSITLDGYATGNSPITETLIFNTIKTLSTNKKFIKINSVIVDGYCSNQLKGFGSFSIKEKYSVTYPENLLSNYPVLRYSYQVVSGAHLNSSVGNSVVDNNAFFSVTNVGNYLYISSGPATGYYLILGVSQDNKTLIINSLPPSFTNASYQILNVSAYNSGLQNGYFFFEKASMPGKPFYLQQGNYEFDYYSYLEVPMEPLSDKCFIGSDFNVQKQLVGIIDELNITSNMMTDTRVGEITNSLTKSITKDYNSPKELIYNSNTLMLCHFESLPLINESEFYIKSNKEFLSSSVSVNDNFTESLLIQDKPLILDNYGILSSKNEGTIEFWINPKYDTYNDPNLRYYFDATSAIKEEVNSIDNIRLKLKGKAASIISVKLKYGDQKIDYFAGGRIELSANNAISEQQNSVNSIQVNVQNKILQVISVKILNDPSNIDYFANGVIGTDKTTIYLGKPLPVQNVPLIVVYKPLNANDSSLNNQIIILNKELPFPNTPVVVTYVPSGMHGDRVSIYKDQQGYLNFNIRANNIEYLTRAPALWSQNTWHRVKATFKVNNGPGKDEMRLFVDGYEESNILFGNNIIFGNGMIFGMSSLLGLNTYKNLTISFKDPVNEIFIGNSFDNVSPSYALFNNLRISNFARPVYSPFGESIDVAYNSNINAAIPVTKDLYTTFLLDIQQLIFRNENYAILRNEGSNNFDFNINVFDTFDIIKNSNKIKEILEILINALKPANSRAFIKYII